MCGHAVFPTSCPRLLFLGIQQEKLDETEFRNSYEVTEIFLLDVSCCQGSKSYYYLKKQLFFSSAGPLVKPRGLLCPQTTMRALSTPQVIAVHRNRQEKMVSVPHVTNRPVLVCV